MSYAYWKNKRHNEPAVFEAYFRKNPFKGNYTVFAGLDEALRFVSEFKFKEEHI
jgi:nicotinate phosphoribosyltransferase